MLFVKVLLLRVVVNCVMFVLVSIGRESNIWLTKWSIRVYTEGREQYYISLSVTSYGLGLSHLVAMFRLMGARGNDGNAIQKGEGGGRQQKGWDYCGK